MPKQAVKRGFVCTSGKRVRVCGRTNEKKKGFWIAKEYDKNVGFKQKKGDGDDFTVRASKQDVFPARVGGPSLGCAQGGFGGEADFQGEQSKFFVPFFFF